MHPPDSDFGTQYLSSTVFRVVSEAETTPKVVAVAEAEVEAVDELGVAAIERELVIGCR